MKYKPTFWLKDARRQSSSIICAVYLKGTRVRFATGQVVNPKHWSLTRQRCKAGAPLASVINDNLDRIALDIAKIIVELQDTGSLSAEAIRERYADLHKEKAPKPGVLDAYEQFLTESEARLQKASIAAHKVAKKHLKEFAEAYPDEVRLGWDRLDPLFYEKLVRYLSVVVGLNNVSLWKNFSMVRTFLRWAYEKGYTDSTDFQKFTRRKLPKGEQSLQPYLTMDEVNALIQLDLSDNSRLARVRDTFVFQIHTGMRYGDVLKLRQEHIHGDTIRLVTQKNRKGIQIPMLPEAKRIWQMYEGKLPVISNQKYNKYLKQVMEKAGIDSLVSTVDYKGAQRIEETKKKSELIGTHSAKRTFVTILRSKGASVEAICKVTGNSRRTIETYIVATEQDAQREIIEAWS